MLSRRLDHEDSKEEGQVMIKPEKFVEINTIEPEWVLEESICNEQATDPLLKAVLLFFANSPEKSALSIQKKFKDYSWNEGFLQYKGKLIVPDNEELKRQVCKMNHDHPTAGHPGQEGTR